MLNVIIDSNVQEKKQLREEALETSIRENSCYYEKAWENNFSFWGNSGKYMKIIMESFYKW